MSQCEGTSLAQLAAWAIWLSFDARVVGEVFEQVEEFNPSVFRDGAFEDGPKSWN